MALPPGAEGELCVHGPNIMRGYLGHPEATAQAFTADGYLRTGDMARLDADGSVYVGDRIKEFIKVKGYQVSPSEVEGAILELPEVADACVVGVPDELEGESPRAFVVLAPGASIAQEALSTALSARLATYKLPREVRFVEAIPKSPAGKILRRLLTDGK